MDCHVGGFIDLRIRSLVDRVIEVVNQTHLYDGLGGIIKTVWHCKEFDCIQDYDEYFRNHDVKKYRETTYEYEEIYASTIMGTVAAASSLRPKVNSTVC